MTHRHSPKTLVTECVLDSPPEKVWRALTTPHLLAAWLAPGVTGTKVGDRFHLEGAEPADCEILEADPEKRLRLAWRRADQSPPIDSTVTFEISETAEGGTWLRIRHEGLPATVVSVQPRRLRAVSANPRRNVSRTRALRMAA